MEINKVCMITMQHFLYSPLSTEREREGVGAFYAEEWSSCCTVTGLQMEDTGRPDQVELANRELMAGVGLFTSHQTCVEASPHAISVERQPPYVPTPQHAFFTSSIPKQTQLGLIKTCNKLILFSENS